MTLVDTHCHIHDSEFYPENRESIYAESQAAGVVMICVGTDEKSSYEAVEFAKTHEDAYAIVGVHPHEAKAGWDFLDKLVAHEKEYIVGIGEIGLDYFYTHSTKEQQQSALRAQLAVAEKHDLPVSFHVREAFDDFWPILEDYGDIRGVLHSYTDTAENAERAIKKGLLFGVNGISTFTKDSDQLAMFAALPLEKIVLETDAPFLTPRPLRGKVNKPAYIGRVAEHQAMLKEVPLDVVVHTTTDNARQLFNLK